MIEPVGVPLHFLARNLVRTIGTHAFPDLVVEEVCVMKAAVVRQIILICTHRHFPLFFGPHTCLLRGAGTHAEHHLQHRVCR